MKRKKISSMIYELMTSHMRIETKEESEKTISKNNLIINRCMTVNCLSSSSHKLKYASSHDKWIKIQRCINNIDKLKKHSTKELEKGKFKNVLLLCVRSAYADYVN